MLKNAIKCYKIANKMLNNVLLKKCSKNAKKCYKIAKENAIKLLKNGKQCYNPANKYEKM